MFPRRTRSNARTVVEEIFLDPNPISALTQPMIDANNFQNLSRPRNVRWGEKSSPAMRATGDVGPQQIFSGNAGMTANIRIGPNTALPATSPPAFHASEVLDVLSANGAGRL